MAILVDSALWTSRGQRFCHLASDTSFDELHAFATALGLPLRAFHRDHYDLPERLRAAAVDAGALPVGSRELVRRVRLAGLRRVR